MDYSVSFKLIRLLMNEIRQERNQILAKYKGKKDVAMKDKRAIELSDLYSALQLELKNDHYKKYSRLTD